ncbi:unnamed protein product [Cylicocyclus nassatus]|uniref:Uncharacterized protein n=1 Tax=Cylicocyclus nassatus TaxID=53992 RepID=A0AA36GR90_CYLNA|nr:unnamed protein product [Cylicocyclus nassatus]
MRVLFFLCLLPSCYCAWYNHYTQLIGSLIGSLQSSAATVTLRCDGKPFTNAKISMYDAEVTFDVWMAGPVKPDNYGRCHLAGSKREISSIEPYLYIKHWCKRKGQSQAYAVEICIDIPSYCISYGSEPKQSCHFGLELTELSPSLPWKKGSRQKMHWYRSTGCRTYE